MAAPPAFSTLLSQVPDLLATLPRAPTPALSAELQERVVLLLNHVLRREPEATLRLRPLAGVQLQVVLEGRPAPWLPVLPPLALVVTPAGLFERLDIPDAAAPLPPGGLRTVIDGSTPLRSAWQLLQGQRPAVRLEGDAATASVVNWLFEHLRWDLGDELQRLVGPAPAQWLAQGAAAVRSALRQWIARPGMPGARG